MHTTRLNRTSYNTTLSIPISELFSKAYRYRYSLILKNQHQKRSNENQVKSTTITGTR